MLFDKLIQAYLWVGATAGIAMMVVIPALMATGVLHD